MDDVELVAAVLHRVGKRRTRRGTKLAEAFGAAAREYPEVFRSFVAHPAYGDCPALDEALQILHLGGSIGYWSPGLSHLEATDCALKWGGSLYEAMDGQSKEAVDSVAKRIREIP